MRDLEFAAIATHVAAEVMDRREAFRIAYQTLPNESGYWAMVDLAGSTAYRQRFGPQESYVHGETFLQLARFAVGKYQTAVPIKELGDALMWRARDFRDVLEPTLLMDAAGYVLSSRSGDPRHGVGIRAAITAGSAKLLQRDVGEDYLGEPLDRLARLLAYRESSSNILLDRDAVRLGAQTVAEYPALRLGEISVVPGKGQEQPVRCAPLFVDRDDLADFREFFAPWKSG